MKKTAIDIRVWEIDSAITMCDAVISEAEEDPMIHFVSNDEYKYLAFLPLFDDGSYAAVCSKDMKEWVLCVEAIRDGKSVDINKGIKWANGGFKDCEV